MCLEAGLSSSMQPQDFSRYLRRTVLVPVILLAVLAAVLLWQISYMVGALRQVDRSDRIIADAHLLVQQVVDMETGLRGYLLTADGRFLEPYERALQDESRVAGDLEKLLGGDSAQLDSLRKIQAGIDDWKGYADQMIRRRRTGGGFDPSASMDGKQRMDAIRAEGERLIQRAEAKQLQDSEGAQQAMRTAVITLSFLTGGIAIILVVVTRYRMMAISDTYNRHLQAERQQTEEARANREWLLTTLRSIGEAVIATDPLGRIEFLNSAAEALTGWKRHDARGRAVTDVLKTFDEGTGLPIMDPAEFVRSRQKHEAQTVVSVLERRDGERRLIDESAAPILDSTGRLRGIVLVFRDMTERRRTENALRSSERLALVGRLSATIAHEIQNPLDAVTNLLYLIEHTSELPSTVSEYARIAQDEILRITQITRQLLSFNREAREPVLVDLKEVIESVLGLFGPKLTSNGIRVRKDYETTEKVMGLPGELRQVFSNLIGNAMEATGKGGQIDIKVNSANDWRDGHRKGIRVVVSDNGTGIPKLAKQGLFTRFFTTKGEKGTGLGLWVSKGIVEKHEGSMRFRSSTEGSRRGTTFMVFLPLEPTAKAQAGNAA